MNLVFWVVGDIRCLGEGEGDTCCARTNCACPRDRVGALQGVISSWELARI